MLVWIVFGLEQPCVVYKLRNFEFLPDPSCLALILCLAAGKQRMVAPIQKQFKLAFSEFSPLSIGLKIFFGKKKFVNNNFCTEISTGPHAASGYK